MADADVGWRIAKNLGNLLTRDERKWIPNYNGYASDQPINDWFGIADAIADANEWKEEFTWIRVIGTRFTWLSIRIFITKIGKKWSSLNSPTQPYPNH